MKTAMTKWTRPTAQGAAISLLLVSLGLTATAAATTVPSAIVSGNISSWDTGCNATLAGAGSATGGCTLSSQGDVSISANFADGTGTVSAVQSSFAGNFSEQENAQSRVTYFFEVQGPSSSSVNLDFAASGQTSAFAGFGSYGTATASIMSGDLGTTLFTTGACSSVFYTVCGSAPSAFSVNQPFTVTAGSLYAVVIVASGTSDIGGFSASVDPSISFNPSFDSTGYSISFSADLAPVPLPASAWLMFTGLGALGLSVRRRSLALLGIQGAVE
ncbi:MAG TPA: VPLPA-CTERM sorting domain-containing protein [Steroidobacteraceae bacterium]|nr:VPLPA-CTERM sorting domain-containing protein [Steroidobacteraceae bacterium]